jgi:hypothetical protein
MGSTPNSAQYCKHYNEWATIGASERVTIQAGGCGKNLQKVAEFTPEGGVGNPFLHLSMHLALREQVGTDRPAGIARVHAKLAARHGRMDAEHRMMEALGRALWDAQRAGGLPDENAYLEELRRLR